MSKLEINAILYSKQNLAMAGELKTACRELGISLVYAIEIIELLKYLNELAVSIVFVDCNTIKLDSSILGVIKSFGKCEKTYIACLTQDVECKYLKSLENVDFILKSDNLFSQLKEIEGEISLSCIMNNIYNFNLSEVNNYLTDYLINIGLETKLAGFTYIKQAVELAIKNNCVLGSLNRVIYPTIASKNKTETQNVERNIRNAIKCACRGNLMKNDNIKVLLKNNTISNRAFLSYLLDKTINIFSYKN